MSCRMVGCWLFWRRRHANGASGPGRAVDREDRREGRLRVVQPRDRRPLCADGVDERRDRGRPRVGALWRAIEPTTGRKTQGRLAKEHVEGWACGVQIAEPQRPGGAVDLDRLAVEGAR